MSNCISTTPIIPLKPQKKYHVGEHEIETPKFTCRSCAKRREQFCDCFQRRIEPDVNKCFNHSNYNPILAVFKPRTDLEKLIQAEEEALSA